MLDFIKYPILLTEKTSQLLEYNKYTFNFDVKATKLEIKEFIEKYYKVKIKKINTHRLPIVWKAKRGQTNSKLKRVIVTLEKNEKINLI
jgi:large subunit ribosomal protein L23